MTALPSRRAEDWRWADLQAARAQEAVAPPANDRLPDVDALWLDIPGERRLFVGGRPVHSATEMAAMDAPPHPLADRAADAPASLFRIPAGTDGGRVQILHVGTSGAAHGRTLVELGSGARLTLVEVFADDAREHWLNHRVDVRLGEGAWLERIVRVVNRAGLVSDRLFAHLAAGARFRQLLVATSAAALRSDCEVEIAGEGAHADVNGVLLGAGQSAQDALTRVRHAHPGATSDQKWRLVGTDKAQVSVSGGVQVARDAQKTEAEQSLRALLMRRTATANLKPELEIFADDVKCAHGCTVGELDKAALFYLESRGISPDEAKALLTGAFVADALEAVADAELRAILDAETQGWLRARAQGAGA